MNMAVVTLFRLECCKLVYGNSVLEGFLQFENFLESLWVRTRLNVARLDNIQIGFLIWFLEVQKAFTHWENSKVKLQNTYELFDDKCVCLLNCGEYNLDTSTVNIHWFFIQLYAPPSPCCPLLTSLITRTLHICCNLLHEGLLSWQRDTWGYRSTNNPRFNIYIWMLALMGSVTLWKGQIAWSAFSPLSPVTVLNISVTSLITLKEHQTLPDIRCLNCACHRDELFIRSRLPYLLSHTISHAE